MTRLIDADSFSNEFNSAIYNKLQEEYLNSTADDKTKDIADFVTTDIMTVFNSLIDNATTVTVLKDERPKACFNCEHCCVLELKNNGEILIKCNLGNGQKCGVDKKGGAE